MAQGELDFAIETISASRSKPDDGDDFNNFLNSFFDSPEKQNQQTGANPF